MKSSNRTGRARVLIVDADFGFGLTLADSLATSGYHPVLVRRLESVLDELSEIRPEAILLGSGPDHGGSGPDGGEEFQLARKACPTVPVIAIATPKQRALTVVPGKDGWSGSDSVAPVPIADLLPSSPDRASTRPALQMSFGQ